MKRMKAIGSALVAVLLLSGPLCAQQPPPKAAPPAAAQDGFVPVDSPIAPEDAMPAPRLVAIAYGFIWLVFFGYLLSLRTRLSTVEKELAAVRQRAGGLPSEARSAKEGS
jgi:CcmD family protein